MLKRLFVTVVALLSILVGTFFAVGGMQIIRAMRGPRLPAAANPGSPQTDFAYYRRAILYNERGADPGAMKRFEAILNAAAVPRTPDELSLVASEARSCHWRRALYRHDAAHGTSTDPRSLGQ